MLLLVCSAIVSGSEVAYFSLSPQDIDELKSQGDNKSDRVLSLLAKPRTLLATILIANNFINIGIVLLSSVAINGMFNFTNVWAAFFIQVIAVTLLILIIGEVIPKVFASYKARSLALLMGNLLWVLCYIFKPLSKLLVRSTNYLEDQIKPKSGNISVNELEHALDLTEDEQSNEEEQRILRGIVKFGNTEVRQIMTSRVDAVALDAKLDYQAVYDEILQSGYSRIPVYENTFDNIIGILYIKDLLEHLDDKNLDWKSLLRQPYFVPETKKIVDLLKEFQDR
ncbi:MAG: CNNM domain-containing protein, partial [Luteibaculum sp.]